MTASQPWHCPVSALDRRRVAQAWGKWMPDFGVSVFGTFTYDPARWRNPHPEQIEKHLLGVADKTSRLVYGNNYARRGVPGLQFIAGVEPHKSGKLHAHALLGDPLCNAGSSDGEGLRAAIDELWQERYGFARIECSRDPTAAAAYLSKYVLKQGEIVISPKFELLHIDAPQHSLWRGT